MILAHLTGEGYAASRNPEGVPEARLARAADATEKAHKDSSQVRGAGRRARRKPSALKASQPHEEGEWPLAASRPTAGQKARIDGSAGLPQLLQTC